MLIRTSRFYVVKMNKPKKHHFVPKFYIDNWNNKNGLVRIYLKGNPKTTVEVSSKDICFETNLYTKRGGRVEVEINFFGRVDGNASKVLKVLLEQGINSLDQPSKEAFALFVNTLHGRNPEFLTMVRDFNERMRKKGENVANKIYEEGGEDTRKTFAKPDFCDSPFLIEYDAKGKDFDTIVNAHWEIFENNTDRDFITSDFPLSLFPLGGPDKHGVELPDEFLLALPLSPRKLLLVADNENKIELFTQNPRKFVAMMNDFAIARAANIIISNHRTPDEYIMKKIALK